jgi:hypothetical protein
VKRRRGSKSGRKEDKQMKERKENVAKKETNKKQANERTKITRRER